MSFNHTWRRFPPSLATHRRGKALIYAISGGIVEEQQIVARRLVSTLEATELRILLALMRGMSAKDTAAATGFDIDTVERSRACMLKKLGADRAADAVRIGLYARLQLTH
jgi:FixJ family two-component response regulator